MLDSGNRVGLGDDNIRDKGWKYNVNSGCRSSWWAVKVKDSTIDGGEDGLLVDSDGVPDRSKKDGMIDDDDDDDDNDDDGCCDNGGNNDDIDDDDEYNDDGDGRKSSRWAAGISDSTIDGGEEGVLVDSDGVLERSK